MDRDEGRCACGVTCQDTGEGKCRYAQDAARNADDAFALGIALERCMVAAGVQYGTTRSVSNLIAGARTLHEWIVRRTSADAQDR
jgi:hypothetical protein